MKEAGLLIQMQLGALQEKVDDLVQEISESYDLMENAKRFEEYLKLRRLENLYVDAIQQGWDEWSWEKAEEKGILCKNDYKIFDELKGKTPLMACGKDWDKWIKEVDEKMEKLGYFKYGSKSFRKNELFQEWYRGRKTVEEAVSLYDNW